MMVSGCSAEVVKENDPDSWISMPPQKAGFLYGVGSATILGSQEQALKQAREIALTDIAQQIEVTVSSSSSSMQQERFVDEQSESITNYTNAIQTRVPEFTFKFYQQMQSTIDKTSNILYVLLELDLSKELSDLRRQILQLDVDIQTEQQSVSAATGFSGLQQGARQLQRLAQRSTLQQEFNRLSRDNSRPLLEIAQQEHKNELLNKIAQTPIGIVSISAAAEPLMQQLTVLLTQTGLSISTTDHELIFIEVDISESTREENGIYYHFVDGRYRIVNEIGIILREEDASAKGSSATRSRAHSRATNKLAKRLANGLIQTMMGE
jgi:hypothetical protein